MTVTEVEYIVIVVVGGGGGGGGQGRGGYSRQQRLPQYEQSISMENLDKQKNL
jgi:hypothetical protein